MALQPLVGLGLPCEVFRSHTHSVALLWSSQRPLPDNKQQTQDRDIHAPQRNSNPQSQQARGRRPTPQTTRELRLAIARVSKNKYFFLRSSPGDCSESVATDTLPYAMWQSVNSTTMSQRIYHPALKSFFTIIFDF